MKTKTKVQIVLDTDDWIDAQVLARSCGVQISAYINSLIKIAISKDLDGEPFIIIPEIQLDIINHYYLDNKNGIFTNKGSTALSYELDYPRPSLATAKKRLIDNEYITNNMILTKGYQALQERGLL